MEPADSTCWTVLHDAATGGARERAEFARRYAPMVRAYLGARWRSSPMLQELDDAVQDVFVECLRHGGVLERARPGQPGGFRAYLYGVVRNVALRVEQGRGRRREHQSPDGVESDALVAREEALSHVFDRAWARTIMREAATRQAEAAATRGEAAIQRVELLRLRFQESLPIREIARLWEADPVLLHREYARAREEFKAALLAVMTFHHPGSSAEAEDECRRLLELLE
jgi:RNA polymerase sigma factor (sigma-70 family)